MDRLELSRFITVIASIAITLGLYDQAVKIWRTRSVKDFTLTLVAALVFNEAAWLNYGLALQEWPIIAVGCANLPAVIIASIGFLKYRTAQ